MPKKKLIRQGIYDDTDKIPDKRRTQTFYRYFFEQKEFLFVA